MRVLDIRVAWVVGVCWSSLGCSAERDDAGAKVTAAPAAELLEAGPALDVSSAFDAARARVRFEAGRWVGEGHAHRLSVGNDGARLTAVLGSARNRRFTRLAELSPRRAAAFDAARATVTKSAAPSQEFTFRTTSIARAGYECVSAEPALGAQGAVLERRFETCRERWQNRATGAEHSIAFDRAPSGTGDLVVQVAAQSALSARVRTDARGIHFIFGDGAGLRYGHGTWVDDTGRKTSVPARWAGDHIELRVPGSVLAESRFPAVLDPDVGPEIGTEPPVYQPSDFGHNPELATDGSGFLSVQEVDARIRAVRVDANGKLLDANWLDLGASGVIQLYPSVAFGGGHYLVTWSELTTNENGDSTSEVRGRFVRPDGTIEGSASFVLSTGSAIYSSVGWDGARFVLAYLATGGSTGNDVHSVLIDVNGARVAGTDQALSHSGSASNPRLDVGSGNTLVAWEEYTHSDLLGDVSTIFGARVARSGAALDATPFRISSGSIGESAPDVAAGSGGFLVTYQLADGSAVRASVVTDAGSVSARGFVVSHGEEGAGLPSAVFDGSQYLVAWADGRDSGSLYGTRVSLTGVPGATDTRLANDSPRSVGFGSEHTNLAWNGSHYLLTFMASYPKGVEGSLLRADLSIDGQPLPLTAIPSSQSYPYVSFDGSNYVVGWTDRHDSDVGDALRSVRISGAGVVLDPAGLAISTPEQPAFGFAVASNAGSTLFMWSGSGAPTARRSLSSTGVLGSVAGVTTEHRMSSFGLASNGQGYFFAFNSGDSSDAGAVYGHLLDATGAGGTDLRLDAGTLNTGPFVIPSEGGYLVAYARSGMRLVRVSASGAVGAPLDLVSDSVLVSGATSGASTLITWSDSFGSDSPLRARLLRGGAYVGAPLEISSSSAGYGSAVAWDGTSYWAVWEAPSHHLFARSISESGELSPASVVVDEEVYAPALASDGHAQMLLSYAKLSGQRRSYRVTSRLVGRGALISGGAGNGGASNGGASNGGASNGGASNGGVMSSAGGAAGGSVATSGGDGFAGGSNAFGGANAAGGSSAAGTANTAGSLAAGGANPGSGGAPNARGGSSGGDLAGSGGTPTMPQCSVQRVGAPSTRWAALGMLGLALFGRSRRRGRRASSKLPS